MVFPLLDETAFIDAHLFDRACLAYVYLGELPRQNSLTE